MNALLRSQRKLASRKGLYLSGNIQNSKSPLFRTLVTKSPRFSLCNGTVSSFNYQTLSPVIPSVPASSDQQRLAPFAFQTRSFSVSSRLFDQPSSKVEASVQTIKNKQKEKAEEDLKKEITQILGTNGKDGETAKAVAPTKKPLKQRIWEEVLHYYHGFRLLFIDINISRKLLGRVLNGKKLTRRENRLLIRTTSDLFRLIPFSIFIIVPFMEFLLPVFIKFFPGMLPSTFQTAKVREDRLKQSLHMKLEVAKFLQQTLDEMALQHKDHKSEEAKQFSEFFMKIRDPKEFVSSEDIIKFSKRFEDEITLDSLSREQLMGLCRILDINTIGTTNFLRFHLRMKLRMLAADDKVIAREGVDELNIYELQQACKARGMRAYGLSEEKLRSQLKEWIELSLNERVPPTLLLLSRALMTPDDTPTSDKLKETIRVLPDVLAAQTKAAIGEREGKIDNKTKIEIIKEEERRIREEREEEREEAKEKAEILVDKAKVLDASTGLEKPVVTPVESGISTEDVELLGEALQTLSKDKKNLLVEKETIKELKEEIEDYKEDVEELREITIKGKQDQIHESRAAKILFKKVNKMIGHLDKVMNDLETKGKAIKETQEKEAEVVEEELVHIDDLVNAIKKLKTTSDESRLSTIEKVLSKIDADQDGQIKVDDVLKVIEAIGRDNVQLSEKQLEELLDVLDKEEILEAEDKIEKAIAKSLKEASKQKDAEELVDKAPIIEDKAENIECQPADSAALKEAAIKQKKEMLQKNSEDISSTIPPQIPTASKQQNSKDKML